jgi:hypothetical protein
VSLPLPIRRLPLLIAALLVLLVGLWAGLLRLGWAWPAVPVMAIVYHGPLMIGGFLGTIVGLERAVALGRPWAYAGPVASAAGAIWLILGFDPAVGQWLLLAASAGLVGVFVVLVWRHPALFTIVMALGAVAWVAGNALWIRSQVVPAAVPCWIAFLVLTVVGERLELCRFLPRTRARQPTFVIAVGIYLAGVGLSAAVPSLGAAIGGVGLLGLAGWLFVFDLARRTIRQRGLTRFAAACLLSGYGFLALGGGLMIGYAAVLPAIRGTFSAAASPWLVGFSYDAVLHAVLLGFVFAMIFGHAPIIFPAVLAVRMEYRRRFYAHLVLLQLSVLLRVACDVGEWDAGRRWAGLINATAIVLFLANTVGSLRRREPYLLGTRPTGATVAAARAPSEPMPA